MRTETILAAMAADKKRVARQLRFVLPLALGEVAIVDNIPIEDVITVIEEVRARLDAVDELAGGAAGALARGGYGAAGAEFGVSSGTGTDGAGTRRNDRQARARETAKSRAPAKNAKPGRGKGQSSCRPQPKR